MDYRIRLVGVLCLAVGGCMPDGFLITPVSTKRRLVETTLMSDSAFAGAKIVVIDVDGILINGRSDRFFGSGEHPVSLLLEQLDKARMDKKVRAVILRINSPGGSVTASQLMHDEVAYFKKKSEKPVVAVMMDVCASGGYYIACAADSIVAQPSTVTGSIGVIMQTAEISGTLAKIGVTTDAIVSGPNKDAGSPLRPMKAEEREIFQSIVTDHYERFVDVVVAGRPKLTEEQVRRLADGRVYTASQALENGLVDRVASLREVIADTKVDLDVDAIKLVAYRRPLGYKPNYYAVAPGNSGPVNLINIDLPSWLRGGTPRFMYLWAPGLH